MKTWYNVPKRSKYGSEKTEVDGILFDSRKEAKRYKELKLMQAAGEIKKLRLQPEFELIPRYKKGGHVIRRTVYRADFEYYDQAGRRIVEDVKGYKTEVYRLKKKMLEYKYQDIELREI